MSKSSNWESTIKPIVVLSVISLIVSLLLALVNSMTAPVIAENTKRTTLAAYVGVLPSVSDASELEEVTDYTTAGVTGVVKAPDGSMAIKAEESGFDGGIVTVIVGMDAELPAIKRLVKGTQDASVYMDLKAMAVTAANEAYNLATNKPTNVNAAFDNKSASTIKAYLVNGKIITRENIDRQLIDTGVYTREEVYGK